MTSPLLLSWKKGFLSESLKASMLCALISPAPALAFEFMLPRVTAPQRSGLNRFNLSRTEVLEGTSTDCSNFTEDELERFRQSGLVVCHGPSQNSFRLIRGVVVCHPDADITVRTKFGDVNVHRGSVVLLTLIDDCLGIHSLHQNNTSSVTWTDQGVLCCLYPGKQLIIAPTLVQRFEELPIAYRKIAHRRVEEIPIDKYKRGFYMDFSIPSAIAGVQPLKEMLFSGNRRDKSAINKVLKDNVILVGLDNSWQPYGP
jgi:hypothetical protein